MTLTLYDFWRSSACYRVRIALRLAGLDFRAVQVDLLSGENRSEAHLDRNPQGLVPALEIDGRIMTQSLAIVEYLDETRPDPPLLPPDAKGRARVRGIAQIASADAHPLIVPRVRAYLTGELKLSDEQLAAWARRWMGDGLAAMEAHLAAGDDTGRFCHGDRPGLADLCLVPQVVGAGMFGCPTDSYPTAMRIFETCMALDAFADAHPRGQPDFPAGR